LKKYSIGAALMLTLVTGADAQVPETAPWHFHRDHVLGTSFDLDVAIAREVDAQHCERVALEEIERLNRILSSYSPDSELSRLNRATEPVPASSELISVLRLCASWRVRTEGAFNAGVGAMCRTWAQAEREGHLPSRIELDRLVGAIARQQVRIDAERGVVERLDGAELVLDGVAKGFIIDRAIAAVRAARPEATGLLLAIGGDMMAWGTGTAGAPWRIGVADPKRTADNAPPLATLAVSSRAVATSAGYARYYEIGGRRYSHVIDPRTGWSASETLCATVVAPDAATADALATALHVLAPARGLETASDVPGVECLVIGRDGTLHPSRGWNALVAGAGAAAPLVVSQWPAGHVLDLEIVLPAFDGPRYRRPYVAFWIENADKQEVRTLAVWGTERKYLADLRTWWRIARRNQPLIDAVTRATRRPGTYHLAWDGTGNDGKPLPKGTYVVHVEIAREHGGFDHVSEKIECADTAVQAKIEARTELGTIVLRYGPPSDK